MAKNIVWSCWKIVEIADKIALLFRMIQAGDAPAFSDSNPESPFK